MRSFICRPSTVLLVLVIWFPFEDFILKWMPVSDVAYSWVRLASEAVIYALLVAVLATYGMKRKAFKRTPIDLPLLLFVACAALSVLMSGAPLLGSFINFRVLLRYVAVFYIVVHIGATPEWTGKVVRAVLVIAAMQAGLALAQYVAGDAFGTFFLPRATAVEVGGYQREFTVLNRGLEVGAVMGTFGHSVSMALFLLLASALVAGRGVIQGLGRRGVPFLLLLALAVAFTYARAILLATALVLPVAAFASRSVRWWRRMAVVAGMVVVALLASIEFTDSGGRLASPKDVALSPLENIASVSDAALWRSVERTRIWLLREVGGLAFSRGALGYGPDVEHAKRSLVRDSHGGLARLIEYRAFEDVYWVAMLVYYGVPGLLIFWWLLARLYRVSRAVYRSSDVLVHRRVALTLSALLLLTFPLALVNNVLEVRTFSYYFWLFSGIVCTRAASRGQQGQTREQQDSTQPSTSSPVPTRGRRPRPLAHAAALASGYMPGIRDGMWVAPRRPAA